MKKPITLERGVALRVRQCISTTDQTKSHICGAISRSYDPVTSTNDQTF